MKPTEIRQKTVRNVRKVVVKIGSSFLVAGGRGISQKALQGLGSAIAGLRRQKIRVILVSSGAIAAGMHHMGQKRRPKKMPELQACAAVGQPILMQSYQKAFGTRLSVAQMLLTAEDFNDHIRFRNAKHTLNELLRNGVVPIVNENDTVADAEIRVGDNDNLAAQVAVLANADLLILLTDQDGFYTADPKTHKSARRIPVVESLNKRTMSLASGTSGETSVGGMRTKLEAARHAGRARIPTIVAHGGIRTILQNVLAGRDVGTLFLPSGMK